MMSEVFHVDCPTDSVTRRDPDCCGGGRVNPNCMPLEVSAHDPFYSHYHQRCLNMLRSEAGVRPGCRLVTRAVQSSIHQITILNYGINPETSRRLRDNKKLAQVKEKKLNIPLDKVQRRKLKGFFEEVESQ
ncbi:hypothetical protein J6590_040628 [Homalodisca vitripennis]|nr:hypothetical protein J6590_040628 [Homalodisca vitripennis]